LDIIHVLIDSRAHHHPLISTDSDAEVSKKIAADYPELAHGFDCISEKGTTLQMAKGFKNGKGKIVTLLPVNDDGLKEYSGVDVEATLVCGSELSRSLL
jgi:hypothetical protein